MGYDTRGKQLLDHPIGYLPRELHNEGHDGNSNLGLLFVVIVSSFSESFRLLLYIVVCKHRKRGYGEYDLDRTDFPI